MPRHFKQWKFSDDYIAVHTENKEFKKLAEQTLKKEIDFCIIYRTPKGEIFGWDAYVKKEHLPKLKEIDMTIPKVKKPKGNEIL